MSEARRGGWIQTYTGRQFWPLDPRAEDIDIRDIAHALAHQCRYCGHCRQFYSVAEHCVLLSRHVEPEHKRWALMHDAWEAYLVDLARPIKPHLVGYVEAEERGLALIAERFGLTPRIPDAVMIADGRILGDERMQAMGPCVADWDFSPEPLGISLQFWSPALAEAAFLNAFAALFEDGGA